jgi:hypothetical protein
MTLTVELTPELEDRLRQEARKQGMTEHEYVRYLIEHHLPQGPEEKKSLWETLPPEEWIRQTREWTASHQDWPLLPLGADARASFYEGRE